MDLIKIENGQLDQKAVDFIINIETQMKTLKQQYDEFKSKLQKAMEQSRTIKLEAGNLKITYIGETERESFDSKQFKEDMPDLFDEYIRFAKVKPSVRISIKDK